MQTLLPLPQLLRQLLTSFKRLQIRLKRDTLPFVPILFLVEIVGGLFEGGFVAGGDVDAGCTAAEETGGDLAVCEGGRRRKS